MEGLTLILLYLAIPSLIFSAIKQYLTWRKSLGSKRTNWEAVEAAVTKSRSS